MSERISDQTKVKRFTYDEDDFPMDYYDIKNRLADYEVLLEEAYQANCIITDHYNETTRIIKKMESQLWKGMEGRGVEITAKEDMDLNATLAEADMRLYTEQQQKQ